MDEHTPHEMAEQDEAAAERMRTMQKVDTDIAHGFDGIAATMANLGYEEAAENAETRPRRPTTRASRPSTAPRPTKAPRSRGPRSSTT